MEFRKIKNENCTKQKIEEIAKEFKISHDVAELLLLRGLNDKNEIEKFLNPQICNMHDPFLFNEMDIVVNRINKAIKKLRILQ